MSKGKNLLLYVLLFVFSVGLLYAGNRIAMQGSQVFTDQVGAYTERYIVRVDAILGIETEEVEFGGGQTAVSTKVKFSASVLTGEDKGKTLIVVQSYDTVSVPFPVQVRQGDIVFAFLNAASSTEYVSSQVFRIVHVAALTGIFFILLIVFGRFKGVTTILALSLSVLSVFTIFLPAILAGKNIYFWAVLTCLFTIVVMPFMVGGFNLKSLSAALGSISGVAIAGVLTVVVNEVMRITGMVDDDMMMVAIIFRDKPLDLRALTFAAILIGALGAAIDVSMSIASALSEVHENSEERSLKSLWKNGLNIGRDIMGAQTSTLVLAYIGGALPMTLLLMHYQGSLLQLLNMEMVIVELLQIIIGGFTVLFVIPTTALVCAVFLSRQTGREGKHDRSGGSQRG